MRKFRKLIGVIIAQSESPNQSKFLEGFFEQAFKLNYDVAVFSIFSTHKLSELWHKGEQNIYSLINYNMLDALVILPDTLSVDNYAQTIISEIKKNFRKPVISVDIETEGFNSIFTDDIQSVKKIISHLIEEHQMTDIAFMTGFKGHPHSTNRLTGYYEALIEHNLPIDQSRVFYGDFWYFEGENVVKSLVECGRPLPQAIACAADNMAVSVCEALKTRGIRVPEDIVVTGYDSNVAGINYVPSITSANLPLRSTGKRAANRVHSLITGTEFKDEQVTTDVVIANSCGCKANVAEKLRNEKKVWRDDDITSSFDSNYNFMLEALISEKDYRGFMDKLSWYAYLIDDLENLYLCMCDDWDNIDGNENDTNYRKTGYSDRINLIMHKIPNYAYIEPELFFDKKDMLPALYERRPKPTAFFFSPVHFNDRCFGYAVLSFGDKPISYNEKYRKWIRFLDASLESLRRHRNLQYMYSKMEENAVTDLLTGIYNRNGFNLYAERILDDAKEKNGKFTLIIGDMNNLKYINDTFGHVEGDFAIKSVAAAFTDVCTDDMTCFRIGGDEFVLVSGTISSVEQVSRLADAMNGHLKNVNNTADKPYSVSVSLGWYFGDALELDSVEHVISVADEKMFAAKQKYKRDEGFNYRKHHGDK